MRFITEFETTYEGYDHPNYAKMVSDYKGRGGLEIGNNISEAFGWKENKQRFKILNTLEIEAFPMDKWIDFKNSLYSHMDDPAMGQISPVYILQLIKNLESFNKT